jgi:hypothetical protein
MSLIDRTLEYIKERKKKIESGQINCIPCPFPRFQTEFPGVEQGMYYLVTGGTKSAKSQFTSYFFLYNTILYSYKHRDIIQPKIFYYALEETPQDIVLRFMSFLLYTLSKYTIIISPTELKSTNANKPVDEHIIKILESKEYQDILNYFEQCINFQPGKNPTAIWKDLKTYADTNGTTYNKKTTTITDNLGNNIEIEPFDYYIPNNPNEYVMIIVDHISLISTELGLDLRQSINKLSEYFVILRNRYKYIPIVIQQQNIQSQGLDAIKSNKIRPTPMGCADSTQTSKDCSVMIGIINPNAFEIPTYLDYNIGIFKNNIRFIEIVLNRHGISNSICPLLFIGKNNYFAELPLPKDSGALTKIYNMLDILRGKISAKPVFFIYKLKNIIMNRNKYK